LEAYTLLEVAFSATPADVHRSYRRLARAHHPDGFPVKSPEQQSATVRMAALNRAYALVRDAPLRYHSISQGTDTVLDDSQASIDALINRARTQRRHQEIALLIGFAAVATLVLAPPLHALGVGTGASVVIAVGVAAVVFVMRRSNDLSLATDALLALVRLFSSH
jgi:DnaJ-domain-containing protein 1